MKLLLSPHCDDETLFAAHVQIVHDPQIVVTFATRRRRHYPDDLERERETIRAARVLGVTEKPHFLRVPCDPPDWQALDRLVSRYGAFGDEDRVWAPLPELHGHPDHNALGNLAHALWGDRVTFYSTYRLEPQSRDGSMRSLGNEIVMSGPMREKKLEALTYYPSQSGKPDTAIHFARPLDEYVESSVYAEPSNRKTGLRLNLGSGPNPMEGFDNLDKPEWTFESGLRAYRKESVEAITVSHVLMYVEERNWRFIFKEFFRVLEPGGVVRITEDDIGGAESSRQAIRPNAALATTPGMFDKHLRQAGFESHLVTPRISLYANPSLIQQNYGDPPDVFHIEGVKPL